MRPFCTLLALSLCCSTLILSCKKNDGTASCRLLSAHQKIASYDATTTITYDASGRISSTSTAGTTNKSRTFSYSNDSVSIVETGVTANALYTVVFTTDRKLKDVFSKTATGTVNYSIHYDYNSAGKMVKQTTTYGTTAPQISNITYNASGDAIFSQLSTAASPNSFSNYYTDRALQNGDGKSIDNFLNYGATAVTNAHLIKADSTTAGSGVLTSYSYTFDEKGNILQMTQVIGSSTPATNDYTYDCK